MKKKLIIVFPLLGVTLWSMIVLISSIGKEPWRMVAATIAFTGLLTMSYFFTRKIIQQTGKQQ